MSIGGRSRHDFIVEDIAAAFICGLLGPIAFAICWGVLGVSVGKPTVLIKQRKGRIISQPSIHLAIRSTHHPLAFTDRSSGTCGMKSGDRVRYTIDGRTGVAHEFLQDGYCYVTWDDGTFGTVHWNHLVLL